MKKLVYILFFVTISILFSNCDDFLEYKAYGPPTSSDFWNNDDDIKAAVDGLRVWQAREGIDGRGFMWFENCSDNMVTGRSQGEAEEIKNFQMQPTNGRDAKDNWKWMYTTIAVANDILKQVDDVPNATQEGKNYGKANALFYRAFAYLWLAPWYGDNGSNGGIPIVTENTPIEELDQPRPKSVLENYDMIIDDLGKAAALLPYFSQQPQNQWGRPHKAAAWGYAARAALYAAQYDKKYYDIVVEMTDKIIGMTGKDKRELYSDYTTLFKEANNFSSEYIFSVFGTAVEGPKFHGMSFQKDGYGLYNTWGYFQPTIDLYEAYEEGDRRRDVTILLPGQHIQFLSHDIHFGVNPADISSSSGMTFRKWMHPFRSKDGFGTEFSTNGNNQSTRMGLVLLRYADVLLMKAEALIWSKGEGYAEAKALINQVRKRAGLPANSQATKAQLMNERRCELAFEFQPSRHLDMVRWGVAKEVYAKPLYGLRLKSTIGILGFNDKQLYAIGFMDIDTSVDLNDPKVSEEKKKAKREAIAKANSTYIADFLIDINKLGDSDKDGIAKKRYEDFMKTYKPELEKLKGYEDRPGHIIEGWLKDVTWSARKFNPSINHVFPIPQNAINSSATLKQNAGY